MAKHTLPNLGLVGGYADGDDGWGAEQNANLLKLSALVQGGVISRLAAVPANPTQGDAYILTAAPNAQTVAVYDGAAWTYYTPLEGWLIYDRDQNGYVSFDGAAWAALASGGGGGGIPDAPSDGKLYGRKDGGWVEIPTSGGGGVPNNRTYWRAIFLNNNQDGSTIIAELAFLDLAGVPISSSGAAILYSVSGDRGGYSAAFDNDQNTVWQAPGNVSQYLGLHFTEAKKVGGFRVQGWQFPSASPKDMRLEWSTDGVTWNTRFEVLGSTNWGNYETRTFMDPKPDQTG